MTIFTDGGSKKMKTITYDEETEILQNFADNVNFYRKLNKKRWTEVVGGDSVAFKNGERNPSLLTICKIARRLDVPEDVLMRDGTITLDIAYNVVADDLGVSESNLRRMVDKLKAFDEFCEEWR